MVCSKYVNAIRRIRAHIARLPNVGKWFLLILLLECSLFLVGGIIYLVQMGDYFSVLTRLHMPPMILISLGLVSMLFLAFIALHAVIRAEFVPLEVSWVLSALMTIRVIVGTLQDNDLLLLAKVMIILICTFSQLWYFMAMFLVTGNIKDSSLRFMFRYIYENVQEREIFDYYNGFCCLLKVDILLSVGWTIMFTFSPFYRVLSVEYIGFAWIAGFLAFLWSLSLSRGMRVENGDIVQVAIALSWIHPFCILFLTWFTVNDVEGATFFQNIFANDVKILSIVTIMFRLILEWFILRVHRNFHKGTNKIVAKQNRYIRKTYGSNCPLRPKFNRRSKLGSEKKKEGDDTPMGKLEKKKKEHKVHMYPYAHSYQKVSRLPSGDFFG